MDIDKLLEQIPDKQGASKDTTSRLWKKDVYNFFKDKNIENVLEIGTNQGWTALLFSHISKEVYTVELRPEVISLAKKHCEGITNINFIEGDAYSDYTYVKTPKYFDVVIIDCIHTYEAVIADINRALSYINPDKVIYLVFDDYSHPHPTAIEVHDAIEDSIKEGLKLEAYIGQGEGFEVFRPDGSSFKLLGPEGIILSYGI